MEIEEQHPIPQQVSAYQFKLVGDMTLQQFFQVAGGALIALLIYSMDVPSYVKWPLIFISFLAGVALAFFPLEDRPLAKWIVLFVKAIYSPTLYVWKQLPVKFSYFQKEQTDQSQPQLQSKPQVVQKADETKHEGSTKLEIQEQKFLEKVGKDLIDSSKDLLHPEKTDSNQTSTIQNSQEKQIKDSQVVIPQKESVGVEPQEKPEKESPNVKQNPSVNGDMKLSPSAGQKIRDSQKANFSPDAAPPMPPTKPNIIVGQIVSSEGNIVENAILEIRDSEGRPVRALKSNKLGHFMIVTPLANGNYQIITEKEGLIFDTINLEVSGKIIPPIAIWAKEKVQNDKPIAKQA